MLDPDLLKPIIDEIRSNPLPVSNYRQKNTPNKQSTFGVASRRGQPADYTKLCASHPALYKLLLDLAISLSLPLFSSILVSDGLAHNIKVKNASGRIAVVSCDEEGQGGVLSFFEGQEKIQEPSAQIVLVYYTAPNSSWLPPPSVVYHNNALVFKRGDNIIQGIVRRSKKTSEGIWIEHKDVAILFP
jgi:hypothetical protein